MKLSCTLAFSVASLFFVSAANAADAITHVAVRVAATNDEWTPTTIKVAPGDVLIAHEAGYKVVMGQYLGSTGADGFPSGAGALYMKVGVGAGFKMGASGSLLASQAGMVKLRVNDTQYNDNSGTYLVNLIHVPASLVPPPQLVEIDQ